MLLLPLVASALAAPVVDPFTEPDDSELYRLEERIVTVAARHAQTVEDAPAIVTVVTDREIRDRGYRSLADVLRSLPGVYLTVSNESRTVAWFRGVISADNNKILLLVDGVPWYDGVYHHASIDEYLPLENVRQVEIIKGPGSAIYGTNAFAGVINVVTYGPADLKGGFARVVGGTAFRRSAAAVAGQPFTLAGKDGGVTAYARWQDVEGDGLEFTPRDRRNVSGTDPTRTVNAGLRVQIAGADVRFDLVDHRSTYWVNEQDDALDVFTQSPEDFWLKYQDRFFTAAWTFEPSAAVKVTPRVQVRDFDDPGQYAWFDDPLTTVGDDGTTTTSWSTTLVETFKQTSFYNAGVDLEARPGPAHVWVAGLGADLERVARIEDVYYVDRAHDPAAGYLYYAPETTIAAGYAYLQDTWTVLPALEITAGARLDVHQYYGVFPSPRAGVLLVPSQDFTAKLLYGRAFRAPTAREWLVQVEADEEGHNLFTAGNPDLEPEQIHTVEAEVAGRPVRALRLRGSGFVSVVQDEINKIDVETPEPGLGDNYYANSGGSRIFGGEAQATLTTGPLELDAAYSLTLGEDVDTGNSVYEFPPHMAHLRAGWTVPQALRANVSLDVFGERPRSEWSPDAGAEDGPAFALLGLGVATDALADGRVRVDLSATNLLDTAYETFVYRDDANEIGSDGERRYPRDLEGEGRMVQVGVEVAF